MIRPHHMLADAAALAVGDDAPELEDEIVRKAKALQVRLIHGFGELHCVLLRLAQLPDLQLIRYH